MIAKIEILVLPNCLISLLSKNAVGFCEINIFWFKMCFFLKKAILIFMIIFVNILFVCKICTSNCILPPWWAIEGSSLCELGVVTTQSKATLLHCNPDAKLPINPSGTLQQPSPPPAPQTHTHTHTHTHTPPHTHTHRPAAHFHPHFCNTW